MTHRKDSPTSTDRSLDDIVQEMIDRGVVRKEQVSSWDFLELYHADPATLPVSARRMQLLFHNSRDFADARKEHGLE